MLADLSKKVAIGYLWNLIAKWLNRSIGFISTLCLVRILAPEDFGIVALASIVMAFFVMISNAGTAQYLIKAEHCTSEMLDSAWSLNIILKLACSATLALLANQLASYMNEPVLSDVLLVACLIPVIGSLKNIGLVLYERDLNYKPLTQLSVTVKFIVVPITVLVALYLQNYWALIIGLVVAEVMSVVGSYLVHPYRPKWSAKLWGKQWSFSKWHLISTTTGYVRSRIDAILLGRYLSSTDVGIYRVSQEFAWLPFTELIAPATNSMYSGLTRVREDQELLHNSILRYLAIAYLLVIPSVFGIYALSDLFTSVVLGEKWKDAAPIIGLLALLMLSMPLNISLQSVLTNLSKIKFLVLIDIVMITAIISLILWLSGLRYFDIEQYTQFRTLLVFPFMAMLCLFYKQLIKLPVLRVCKVMFLPVIPSVLMVKALTTVESYLDYPDVVNLLILLVVGVCSFTPVMLATIAVTKNWLCEYDFIFGLLKKRKPSIQGG